MFEQYEESFFYKNKLMIISFIIIFYYFYKLYFKLWLNKNVFYRHVQTEKEEKLNENMRKIREEQQNKINKKSN
jgi:hypothetical protein